MKTIRKLKESTNNFVSSWTKFVIKYKWSVLIGTFVLTLMLGLQGKMNFDGDYHVFFSESNPELEAFDALQEKYTKDDNVILVLTPSNGDVFTKLNLVAIENLTEEELIEIIEVDQPVVTQVLPEEPESKAGLGR